VRESYVLGTNEYPFPSLMWGEVVFQRLRSFTYWLQETMVRESYVLGTNEYPFPSLMWGEVIFQRLRSFTHRLQET